MRDEFNKVKIKNEKGGIPLEFGGTQKNEFSFLSENKIENNDEINDSKIENNENNKEEFEHTHKNNKKKDENIIKHTNGNHLTAIGVVSSTALVAVTTISTLVGINLYYSGKYDIQLIEPTFDSIKVDFFAGNFGEDLVRIELRNDSVGYEEKFEVFEDFNQREFMGLESSTTYTLKIYDETFANYVLYTKEIETLPPYGLNVSIEAETSFAEGVFSYELYYDSTLTDYIYDLGLIISDASGAEKAFEISNDFGPDYIELNNEWDDVIFDFSDTRGFDYYVMYKYNDESFETSKKHVVFINTDA